MKQQVATFGLLLAVAFALNLKAAEPAKIPLWANGAPGEPATKPADEPVLFVHQAPADKANGTAVVICPGGGYGHLAIDHEGHETAEWLNTFGVTALVLKYRHSASGHQHPVPMLDGQRAIRTVRARASEWGIDPTRIGVLGFSAGGHLASTLATHFDSGDAKAADAIDRASSRPDFLILCYPVITMTEKYMHRGSHDNLIGKSPDESLARSLSNNLRVTAETPPTFIFQTDEDKAVPAENCLSFYLALRSAGVPAELHIYQNGKHGLGLAKEVAGTNDWPARCLEWMQVRGLLKPAGIVGNGSPAR
jgi:acetyl esterase/lipase